MSFGERLRDERKAAGMSRCELARRAQVSDVAVLKYERGDIGVVNGAALRLAAALGLGVADLLDPPRFYDVEFEIGHAGAGTAEVDRLVDACEGRVRPWPHVDDGCMKVRTCGSSLPEVVSLSDVDGVGSARVVPVTPSRLLTVLVDASGSAHARRVVLLAAGRAGACPPMEVCRDGSLWRARLRHVPERCSMILQRLAPMSPIGLFVPAP